MMSETGIARVFERTDQSVVEGLGRAGASTVHEALGRRGFAGPHLRPIQHGVGIAGNAVTVLCPAGDNLMIHAAVETCSPGDVLVVTTSEPSSNGMVGELLATSLMARGVVGLVIEAGVRDIAQLRRLEFPVWTAHVSCQGTTKTGAGSVNLPISLGEVILAAGDVICADDDGVVVVAREEAEACLEATMRRLEKEDQTREALAAGKLGLDIYGLRETLEGIGVKYLDSRKGSQS
jgi:4-hydroxy-4-methyl-2-oxoglutarate aldolase